MTPPAVNRLRCAWTIRQPRPVLDVRLANLPVSLALLVDNGPTSARAFSRVQAGLRDFIDRLPANQSMSLLALAPEPLAQEPLAQELEPQAREFSHPNSNMRQRQAQ